MSHDKPNRPTLSAVPHIQDTRGHAFSTSPQDPTLVRCLYCLTDALTWDTVTPCPGADRMRQAADQEAYAVPQRFLAGVDPQVGPPLPPIPLAQSLEGLTEAERLGVIVGSAYGAALADRDKARTLAVALEQDAAEARRHLAVMVALVESLGTTWAHDTSDLEAAQAFLNHSPE